MRKWLALGVQVPFVAMLTVAACSSDDSSNPDAGDSSVLDVKADKKVPIESGPTPDTGSGQCVPDTTIDTSQIKWVPPVTPNPNACSATQVQQLYDGCLGSSASSTACNAFLNNAANATCSKCMISKYGTDTSYGALIQIGGVDYANVSGCIAIVTGDNSSTGCGAKAEAVIECENAACTNACPAVTDQATFTEWTNCTTAADNAVCKTYLDAECNIADAGASVCQQSGFQAYYFAYAPIFCGAYATDGGTTDGGSDASTDSGSDATVSDAATDAPDGD